MTPEDFRHDICASVERPVAENEYGVFTKTIPGGRCARLRHFGATTGIGSLRPSLEALYRDWLPDSGEQPGDFPCFFEFVKRMPAVTERDQETDIYLPLK